MRLLHVDASPRDSRSRSRPVAEAFLAALPHAAVETLDLWDAALPELDGGMIEGRYALIMGQAVSDDIAARWAEVRKFADHFLSFDGWVISTPMWNFGLPYRLKHYVDILTQPGMTFSNDAAGNVVGHASGRRAVLIGASALPIGIDAAMAELDFQIAYLDTWLRFIGVTAIDTIRVAPTFGDPAAVEAVMDGAKASARALALSL